MCAFVTGDSDSVARYEQAAARRLKAIESVLWDDQRGAWFDYNLLTGYKHMEFYPSNLAPLWAMCYSQHQADKAVQYLKVGTQLFTVIHSLAYTYEGINWNQGNDINVC